MNRLSMSCAATVLALALAGGAMSVAQAAVSQKSTRYYEKAQGHVEKGDLNAAVIQLKNAIRSDANNVEARFQLANIYLAIGDPASAEKELKAASARGYERALIIPLLAQSYVVQGKFEDLLDEFEEDQLAGEPLAILSIYRAQSLINLKRLDEARDALEQARGASPQMPQIAMVGSWLRQAEGDLAGAEALIDQALEADPDNVEALIQKAELRRLAQDHEAAEAFSTQALAEDQFRRAPRVTRGLSRAALNRVDETLEDAEVLLERNQGDPVGAFLKAWGYAQKGEVEIALEALIAGQALESFAPALYLGAALYLRTGALEQARSRIDRYLAMVPGNVQALITSGAIHYQAGEFEQAAGVLEPVYQAVPQNTRVVTMLAYAYEKIGAQDKATVLFDAATSLVPDNEDLQLRAAQARIGSGDFDSGIAALTDLIQSETGGERAATLLFLTQLQNKNFEAAASALERLEEIKGKTAETENFRASIALAAGEIIKAEGHLRDALALQEDYQAARLNLGRLFRIRNDFENAVKEYNILLVQHPGYLPALTGLVDIARERQDVNEVLRLIDLATRENPKEEKAHLLKVQHLLSLGRKDRALVAARNFMSTLPQSNAAYDALARGQIATGDLASAVVTYRQLVSRVPENGIAWYRLSQALIMSKNHVEAIVALERTLDLDPASDQARRQRIDMEAKVHGKERALVIARRLYGETSESPAQLTSLGQALVKLGEVEEGLELVVRAYERSGSKRELVALYGVYDRIGRLDESSEVLSKWVTDHPEDKDMRLVLFSRLISAGRWQPAIQEGETLYQADAKNFVVLNNLAWVYEKVGRIEEAKAFGKSAVALAPEAAEIIDTYGWILYEHGDAKEAEAILEKAARLFPARRDIVYHHAAAMVKIGNRDAAKTKLRGLLADGKVFSEREAAAALLAGLE